MNNVLRLFYIGDEFYWETGSVMSAIYEVDTLNRSDWGKVNIALKEGLLVEIRPATPIEMKWATDKRDTLSAKDRKG